MILAPNRGFILGTILFAMFLTLIPLPESINAFRPDWMAMTVLFWSLRSPQHFNLGTAWIIGIALDLILGTLFGQHALALIIFAYIAILLEKPFRAMSIALQVLSAAVMLGIYRTILVWIWGMGPEHDITPLEWMPLLTSAIFWPGYSYLLNLLDAQFNRSLPHPNSN